MKSKTYFELMRAAVSDFVLCGFVSVRIQLLYVIVTVNVESAKCESPFHPPFKEYLIRTRKHASETGSFRAQNSNNTQS